MKTAKKKETQTKESKKKKKIKSPEHTLPKAPTEFKILTLPNSVCHSNNPFFCFKIPGERFSCCGKNIDPEYSKVALYLRLGKKLT